MKLALLPILAVACGVSAIVNPVSAQIVSGWQQTSLTSKVWTSIASSADGTRLVAGEREGGPVYISTNSGATWTPTTLSAFVEVTHTIASSADGTKLAVAPLTSMIYISHDSGATWIARANSSGGWNGIACSADGTKLVAISAAGPIYTSTDSGTNWIARISGPSYSDVASSADGARLVAVAEDGFIYTSTDSGTNWIARASTQQWSSVASSADGTKLVAADFADSNFASSSFSIGEIYTSADSGTNWTAPQHWTAPPQNWTSVAGSTNGTCLAAVALNAVLYEIDSSCAGIIYTSTNSGESWQLAYAPNSVWSSVASSADGTKLFAANGNDFDSALINGGVYTFALPSTNAPALNIATAGGNAFLSWPWPATGFVLQQNSNLATMNWVTVSNTPAVVNQVIAAQTNSQNFYRLAQP